MVPGVQVTPWRTAARERRGTLQRRRHHPAGGADIATAADLTAAENGLRPRRRGGAHRLTQRRIQKIPVVFGRQPEADGEEDEAKAWCDF